MSRSTGNKGRRRAAKRPRQPPSIFRWAGLTQPTAWRLPALLLAVLGAGLAVVKTTHENRFAFNELQELKSEANRLGTEWGQLLIEQSTFSVEGRIESKASEQLDMQVPELSRIVVVTND